MAYINRPKKKTAYRKGRRKSGSDIYNTRLWMQLRECKRRTSPLCEVCLAAGRLTPGAQVHHIVSFNEADDRAERERLGYDPDNVVTVCEQCHRELHHGSLTGCRTKAEIEEKARNLGN